MCADSKKAKKDQIPKPKKPKDEAPPEEPKEDTPPETPPEDTPPEAPPETPPEDEPEMMYGEPPAEVKPGISIDAVLLNAPLRLNGKLYRKAARAGNQWVCIHLEQRDDGLYPINTDRVLLDPGTEVELP